MSDVMALQSQYQSEEKTSPAVLRNYLTFPESILQKSVYLFFFFLRFIYLLEREREKVHKWGERQRKRIPKQTPCPAWSPSWGLDPTTHDLSQNQELTTQSTEPPRSPQRSELQNKMGIGEPTKVTLSNTYLMKFGAQQQMSSEGNATNTYD